MHQELSELRTILEVKGLYLIKSNAAKPSMPIYDEQGREWRPFGYGSSTPEVRMAKNTVPKMRGSVWVAFVADGKPGIELNGGYENLAQRAFYKPIVQGKKFQLSYEESKRFIEECL